MMHTRHTPQTDPHIHPPNATRCRGDSQTTQDRTTANNIPNRITSLQRIGWFAIFASLVLLLGGSWACQSPANTEITAETTTETTVDATLERVQEPILSEPSTEPSSEFAKEPTSPESNAEPLPSEPTAEAIAEAQEMLPPDATEHIAENDASAEQDPETTPETTTEPSNESTPEQATKTFPLEGIVADFFAPGNPTLGGVKVCLYQRPTTPCVLSAQDGSYILSGVPFDTEVAVTFEDSTRDLVPMMFPFYADSKDFVNATPRIRAEMLTKTIATQISALLGVTVDWTKAQIGAELQELDPFLKPVVGGTVVMTPMSGTGPIYLPDPGQSSATSTQSAGLAVFYNVDPNKDYDFVFSHPQRRCYPDNRTRRTATTSRLTAVAGWFVVTSWICDTLPPKP